MLKFRFAPFVILALCAAIALAQEPAPEAAAPAEAAPAAASAEVAAATKEPAKRAPVRRKRRPVIKATPVPIATPAPRKPGFWERVFGKKKAKPTPVPGTPTPKPVVKKRMPVRTSTQKPKSTETKVTEPSSDNEKPVPTETETKVQTEEKLPPKMARPPTAKNMRSKPGGNRVENFPDSTEADAVEKQKYDQAKAKAIADPRIQELRGKADLAPSEDESRKALRTYNKAMFKKIKEIDPSVKERVDRMEAAVMSRLGE